MPDMQRYPTTRQAATMIKQQRTEEIKCTHACVTQTGSPSSHESLLSPAVSDADSPPTLLLYQTQPPLIGFDQVLQLKAMAEKHKNMVSMFSNMLLQMSMHIVSNKVVTCFDGVYIYTCTHVHTNKQSINSFLGTSHLHTRQVLS